MKNNTNDPIEAEKLMEVFEEKKHMLSSQTYTRTYNDIIDNIAEVIHIVLEYSNNELLSKILAEYYTTSRQIYYHPTINQLQSMLFLNKYKYKILSVLSFIS